MLIPLAYVLNRATWCPRQLSRTLLGLLLRHLDTGQGPLGFGIDETMEQRWGARSAREGTTGMPCTPVGASWLKPAALSLP